jgi:peptidyl-prolyl cis-trans isomerase D
MTMLDRMRRHRSWLKWSLALVVLTFVAFYAQDFANPGVTTATGVMTSEVVADVEGKRITAGEFQQRYQNQVQAYMGQYGGGVTEQLLRQLGIDQQILNQMVEEQAALAEAERQGLTVSDEELAQAIFAIPGLQENGRFIGEARYEQLLRSQRPPLSKAQFEDGLRRTMMIDKLRTALTDWIAVSDSEIEREYKVRNEKVKLQVVALTADKFRSQVTVTPQDVSAYYDAHKAEYRKGEQRKIRYVLLDRDQLRTRQQVPAAEVQTFYNTNIQQYQQPEQIRASHILLKTEGKDEAAVRKQAEDLAQKAKAGADFAALARQFSEDGSKDAGGDLDFFGRGRMVAEFETVAFAMQPGQVSDVVKSQFGFHVIKVTDKRAASTRNFNDVRAQIEDQLAWTRTDQQMADRTRELDTRVNDPSDLETVGRELGFTVTESGFFAREDPVPGIGPAPQLAAEAFRLGDNAVSKALTSPRGFVYLTVSGKRDPYVQPLEEVQDRVREDVTRTRATELSRQKAGQIAAALRGARDFAAAAKAQGFEAKDTELIARETALPDVGINQEIDRVAFGLPVGAISEPVTTTDATVIVKVVERDDVTADEFRQARETFRDTLLGERRNRFFSAYMTKAKQNMKIEIRTDVVRRAIGA